MLHIYYLERKVVVVVVACHTWYSQAGGLDPQDQQEIKIRPVSGVMLFPSSIYHVGWCWLIYTWEHGYRYSRATMTVALKDWNLSDCTAWFCNLLPSFQPAWTEKHHVAALRAAEQRVWAVTHTGDLPWRLATASAGHSPPRGYSLDVRTCPKSHWCHQWDQSRSRCFLIYQRVCQAPTAITEAPHILKLA